jgi:hypothetical protein
VIHERFAPTFRAVATRYPTAGIYDRIASSAELADVIAIEALTNPRIREEASAYGRKVRPADRISGPGTTPIIASFAYSVAGRFCDGTYGVYYAGLEEQTTIAESRYGTEVFLRSTSEPSIDVDKRIYTATIEGDLDDVRPRSMRAKIYDPNDYSASQAYGRKLYDADVVDGIVYNSIRNRGGHCIVAFRPRIVSDCIIAKYIQFRWDGHRIVSVADLANIRAAPP